MRATFQSITALLTLWLGLTLPGAAQDITSQFNIQSEIDRLKSSPQDTAVYHYNLGTLYYHMRQFGLSAAHLDKARHLDPWDSDIRANHALATKRSQAFSDLGPLEWLGDHPLLVQLQGISGIFGLVALLFWFKSYLRSRRLWFVIARPAGWFGILVFGSMVFFAAAGVFSNSRPHAYTLSDIGVRSGPAESFMKLKHLESGAKVRFLGRTATDSQSLNDANVSGTPGIPPETWVQVLYDKKDVGWLPVKALLRI